MCLYGFFELRTVPHGWAPVASAAGARWLGAAAAGEAAKSDRRETEQHDASPRAPPSSVPRHHADRVAALGVNR